MGQGRHAGVGASRGIQTLNPSRDLPPPKAYRIANVILSFTILAEWIRRLVITLVAVEKLRVWAIFCGLGGAVEFLFFF
jgi:hypothetical protein